MMVKIASPSDWGDFQQNPLIDLKISSRGWMHSDRLKVASEVGDEFMARVRKIEDELDTTNLKFAHVASCGATEVSGPNRNADGWRGKVLDEQMGSYLKHASCYRNHQNKSHNDCFGKPKLAMYDPSRGYGRVLVGFFATEKACKEPRDKVASVECDALDRGEEIKVSHGASIPFDTCVICGNEAPTRKEYCESTKLGGECGLFGCKHGLKKVADDGRVQYVDNPVNRFYDISTIALVPGPARQADRIAYALPMEFGNKEAGESIQAAEAGVEGSAKLAADMGLQVPDDYQVDMVQSPWQRKMVKSALWLAKQASQDICPEFYGELPEKVSTVLSSPETKKIAAMVQSFADSGQMIGPVTYCKLRGADDATASLVAEISKTAMQALYQENQIPAMVVNSPILNHSAPSRDKLAYGCKLPETCKLSSESIRNSKIQEVLLYPDFRKSASTADIQQATKLSAEYAACKVLAASVLLGEV